MRFCTKLWKWILRGISTIFLTFLLNLFSHNSCTSALTFIKICWMCKNYYRIWFSPHYGNVEGGGGQSNFAVISRKSAFNSSKYLLEKKIYWKRNGFSSNRQEWHEFIIRGISHIAILLQICLALFEKALLSIRNSYHPPYHLLFNVLARLVKYLLIKCQVYLAVSATYRNIFFECLLSFFSTP